MWQVLTHWAETPFFLQLEWQRADSEEMAGTVFDDPVSKLEYLQVLLGLPWIYIDHYCAQADMTSSITASMMDRYCLETHYALINVLWTMASVRRSSREFRREVKWWGLPGTTAGVQAAFCPLLQLLATNLGTAARLTPPQVFTRLWQQLASDLGRCGSPVLHSLDPRVVLIILK